VIDLREEEENAFDSLTLTILILCPLSRSRFTKAESAREEFDQRDRTLSHW
jgi:hypothetical protein